MRMVDCDLHQFTHASLATALAGFGLPSAIFWLYFSGSILLVVGLAKIFKDELPQTHRLDKIMPFGRLFLAIPLAVFGTGHLTNTADIANIVPRWLPAHAFWVYLVGNRSDRRGPEHHRPDPVAIGGNAFGRYAVFIRTLDPHTQHHCARQQSIFLGDWAAGHCLQLRGSCLCGISCEERAHWRRTRACSRRAIFRCNTRSVLWRRTFSAPRVCTRSSAGKKIPVWVPGRLPWAHLAGTVLVAAGVDLIVNQKARMAATCLGMMILLLVLFVYLPILVASPTDIVSLNYFFDTLLFSGAALVLGGALPKQAHPMHEKTPSRMQDFLPQLEGMLTIPFRIAIKAKGRILFNDPADVVTVEAQGNYVLLRRMSGTDLLRECISAVAEKLRPYGFVRIHRSVLINASSLEEIHPWTTGECVIRIKRKGVQCFSHLQEESAFHHSALVRDGWVSH